MTKLWVGVLAGVGGFALGVWVTKLYAENKVTSTADKYLDLIPGVKGSALETQINAYLVS